MSALDKLEGYIQALPDDGRKPVPLGFIDQARKDLFLLRRDLKEALKPVEPAEDPDQPTEELQEGDGSSGEIGVVGLNGEQLQYAAEDGPFATSEQLFEAVGSASAVIGSFSEVSDEAVRAAGGEPETKSAYDLRATPAYDFGPAEETENPI